MKQILIQLIVLTALSFAAFAQESKEKTDIAVRLEEYMEVGAESSDIRFPYSDENGVLKARLHCGLAKLLKGGVAEITNLRIDVYEKGEVFATIFAPKCVTEIVDKNGEKSLEVTSVGEVLLDMDEMTIAGRGFRFSSKGNQFQIHHDTRILLRESARDMRKVEL